MIRKSFIFLPGISGKTEKKLWKQGIDSWNRFIISEDIQGISRKRKMFLDRQIRNAQRSLYNFDSSYFIGKLHPKETWRLYDFFREDSVFLDIEFSGVGEKGYITVVGLYDGVKTKTMIKDVNLDPKELKKELSRYKLIITFNGSSLDLPFIRKRHDILPRVPHIDLRHVCASLGISGGLKEIEKILGIRRSTIVEKIYGGDPLKLWKMYRGSGDRYFLNLLVEYNEDDCFNLKKIMEHCYFLCLRKSFWSSSSKDSRSVNSL